MKLSKWNLWQVLSIITFILPYDRWASGPSQADLETTCSMAYDSSLRSDCWGHEK
jgi:hypothetical protein